MTEPFNRQDLHERVRLSEVRSLQIMGRWRFGTGTPEGNVAAPVGSAYLRDDGGAGTTLYIKESGAGNTGWVAK